MKDIVQAREESDTHIFGKRESPRIWWTCCLGLDHRPSLTVRLRLADPQTNKETTVEEAVMTRKNRQILYRKRNALFEAEEAAENVAS